MSRKKQQPLFALVPIDTHSDRNGTMLQFYENADNVILNQPLGTRLSLSLPSFFDDHPAPSSHAHFLHIYRNGNKSSPQSPQRWTQKAGEEG